MSGAALHADAVRVLSGWRPDDAGQDALRRDFLGHLTANPDGMWRECVPGHLTASVAILDAAGERVLLTLHRKLRKWLPLGGHGERHDGSLDGVALREAREESGLSGLRLLPGPVRVDRFPVRCGGNASSHLNVHYAAVAPLGARERAGDESDDLRWFPVDALPAVTDDAARRGVAMARAVFARHERPGSARLDA